MTTLDYNYIFNHRRLPTSNKAELTNIRLSEYLLAQINEPADTLDQSRSWVTGQAWLAAAEFDGVIDLGAPVPASGFFEVPAQTRAGA